MCHRRATETITRETRARIERIDKVAHGSRTIRSLNTTSNAMQISDRHSAPYSTQCELVAAAAAESADRLQSFDGIDAGPEHRGVLSKVVRGPITTTALSTTFMRTRKSPMHCVPVLPSQIQIQRTVSPAMPRRRVSPFCRAPSVSGTPQMARKLWAKWRAVRARRAHAVRPQR